jgi:aminoglycoside phosphotransferase family enzyme
VEENFTQTERRLGDALPAGHLEAVRRYARGFLQDQRARFLARVRGGRIRDGHGDLRAQNLCLCAPPPRVRGIRNHIKLHRRVAVED